MVGATILNKIITIFGFQGKSFAELGFLPTFQPKFLITVKKHTRPIQVLRPTKAVSQAMAHQKNLSNSSLTQVEIQQGKTMAM
jgi:hypothetical protein